MYLVLGVGCSDGGDSEVGGASVMALIDAADVEQVRLTVTASDIRTPIVVDLVEVDGQWVGIIEGIPAGTNRRFLVEAFNGDGDLLYRGEAVNVTVAAHGRVALAITLQEVDPPPAFGNHVPMIDSVVASSSATGPAENVTLTVAAHDGDSDRLTYAWTATGGTFSTTLAPTTRWTSPSTPNTYRITITVSDGNGGERSVNLSVQVSSEFQRGGAGLNVEFNNAPRDVHIVANPGRVVPGGTIDLQASAVDDDGDSLFWYWLDDCNGGFSNEFVQDPRWIGPLQIPSGGVCTLHARVRDGRGGENTGDLVVQVGTLQTANTAPTIELAFQSSELVSRSGSVVLRLQASDPNGEAISFSWDGGGGTLSNRADQTNQSQVHWRAPATGAMFVVTGTVTDARGASSVRMFTVTVQ